MPETPIIHPLIENLWNMAGLKDWKVLINDISNVQRKYRKGMIGAKEAVSEMMPFLRPFFDVNERTVIASQDNIIRRKFECEIVKGGFVPASREGFSPLKSPVSTGIASEELICVAYDFYTGIGIERIRVVTTEHLREGIERVMERYPSYNIAEVLFGMSQWNIVDLINPDIVEDIIRICMKRSVDYLHDGIKKLGRDIPDEVTVYVAGLALYDSRDPSLIQVVDEAAAQCAQQHGIKVVVNRDNFACAKGFMYAGLHDQRFSEPTPFEMQPVAGNG